jgi:hypothetical protein
MTESSNLQRLSSADEQLRMAFLRWQCRLRQISARNDAGRPSPGMMPIVIQGDTSLGSITTVLCKRPEYSVTMEMRHMVRRTMDPATRRKDVLEFVSETYYQHAVEFNPELTAVFVPRSAWVDKLICGRPSVLRYEQFNQGFDVTVMPRRLSENNPLREATFWHNLLFNPSLSNDAIVIGLQPNWSQSAVIPTA